jgi:hypothetical protein
MAAGATGAPSCSPYLCSGTSAACTTSCTDDTGCANGYYCQGGTCQLAIANGQTCTRDRLCSSGHCADGYCCDQVCNGACDACNLPNKLGACTPLADGSAGSPSCTPYLCNGIDQICPTACSGDADCVTGTFCNAGACTATLANGASCLRTRQCTSGNCVDGYCCDTACGGSCDECASNPGTCTIMPAGSAGVPACAPFLCGGTSASCATTCSSNSDCAASSYCQNGVCFGLKANSSTCAADSECFSGFCTDGFCCDARCSDLICGSCSAIPGRCSAAPEGTAPRGAPNGCGNYACNGQQQSCPNPPACTQDLDCVSPNVCAFGSCVPKLTQSSPCQSDGQCMSNHCIDHVCCDTGCLGACFACNLAGTVGTCTQVQAGRDPRNACGGTGPCKATCNGSGLCAFPGMSTSCGPASCAGLTTEHRASTCDGAGACVDNGPLDCDAYQCIGTECVTTCLDDSVCAPGERCSGGKCGKHQSDGSVCADNSDCESYHCVDQVCCTTACDGVCQRCDVPGQLGTCTVRVGMDPDHECGGDGSLCAGSCIISAGGNPPTGACAYPGPTQLCDTCKACDQAGHCSQLPANGDDPRDRSAGGCGVVTCQGLATECTTVDNLTMNRCSAVGQCVLDNDADRCSAASLVHNKQDGTRCSTGECKSGQCVAIVDGGTGADSGTVVTKDGGCSYGGGRTERAGGLAFLFLSLVGVGVLRRRRKAR